MHEAAGQLELLPPFRSPLNPIVAKRLKGGRRVAGLETETRAVRVTD